MNREAILRLEKISRRFDGGIAADRLSLELYEGEFLTLLGPSGCGKTTTLRMIAGLERPDEGAIFLRGERIVSVEKRVFLEPEKRQMGMVFQGYALWPNMTVFENVAYPLRLRRFSPADVKEKVSRTLRMVGLEGLEERPAPQLSGGQQQRVALARALVYEPKILLLDEPFSNLDSRLRQQMGMELKALQARLGIASIYVTHDQSEALSLSDRIAIMNQGRLEQTGSPTDLYEQPGTPFVRDFLGRAGTLRGAVRGLRGEWASVELADAGGVRVEARISANAGLQVGDAVCVSVRPEEVSILAGSQGTGDSCLQGTVEMLLFLGDRIECQVRLGRDLMTAYVSRRAGVTVGQTVSVCIPPEAATVWRS